MFVLTGCPWGNATTSSHNTGDATGYYYVSWTDDNYMLGQSDLPFENMNIWHDGNQLRGQDNRGVMWHGQTGADIPGYAEGGDGDGGGGAVTSGTPVGFQVFMEAQNQETHLTEWIRGNIFHGTTEFEQWTLDDEGELVLEEVSQTGALLEGLYTRSDGSNDVAFVMVGPNTARFPGGGTDGGGGE